MRAAWVSVWGGLRLALPLHPQAHPTTNQSVCHHAVPAAGKVIFPPQYPYKPPSILMLTPNGRFATNTKLCLRCVPQGVGWGEVGACAAMGVAGKGRRLGCVRVLHCP